MTEIAVEIAFAVMDKQELVAVGIAGQMLHRAVHGPDADFQIGIGQQHRRFEGIGTFRRRRQRVEGVRAQGPLEMRPAGGRMPVIELGGRTEEAVAAHLALIGSLGQIGMGLTRGFAFRAGKFD